MNQESNISVGTGCHSENQKHAILHDRVMRIVLSSLLALGQSACTSIKYFDISEKHVGSSGEFRYAFYSVKQEIMWSKDTSSITDPKFEAFYRREKENLEPYLGFDPDTTKTYWGLQVDFGSSSSGTELFIYPSPITLSLAGDYDASPIRAFDFYRNIRSPGIIPARIKIEPIGIPRDYEQNFTIEMDLVVRRRSDSSLVYEEHVVLPIEFKKRRQMIGSWP